MVCLLCVMVCGIPTSEMEVTSGSCEYLQKEEYHKLRQWILERDDVNWVKFYNEKKNLASENFMMGVVSGIIGTCAVFTGMFFLCVYYALCVIKTEWNEHA